MEPAGRAVPWGRGGGGLPAVSAAPVSPSFPAEAEQTPEELRDEIHKVRCVPEGCAPAAACRGLGGGAQGPR